LGKKYLKLNIVKFIIHTQYYPPEIGAPQARLSELAECLIHHGHDVIILTALPNYPTGKIYPGYTGLFKMEVRNGIKIIRTWIYPTKSVKLIKRLASYFSFVLSSLFVGSLSLSKADYLITESPPLFLGISGFFLSHFKRAKWIFNVSDLWPESALRLGVIREGLSLKLSQHLEAFCYNKSQLVMGQSREILQDIKSRFPKVNVYHFSNGVDTSRFAPSLRSELLHQQLGEGTPCVAIYAGLHGIAQGLDQVLDAARMLDDLNGKLKIVFIGDGPEKESLMEKANGLKLVKFLPPVRKEDIPKYLASSDIALVPLKTYIPGAVPSKIYESMASALPVILIAEGEAKNIIENSKAGLTITPGSVTNLAHAMRQLTMDPALRKHLGTNGNHAALEHFDRKKIIADFLKYLKI
jgi:colanic acid biosynthesis glycosyl transferase WcaI